MRAPPTAPRRFASGAEAADATGAGATFGFFVTGAEESEDPPAGGGGSSFAETNTGRDGWDEDA